MSLSAHHGVMTCYVSNLKYDDRSQGDGGEEDLQAPVITHGDPPSVLQASDPDLYSVAALVMSGWRDARYLDRDTGHDPLVLRGPKKPIRVIPHQRAATGLAGDPEERDSARGYR